jgi:preprotein translocase subunit SecD
MWKKIISALILLILGAGITLFVYKTEPKLNKNFETQKSFFKKFPFRLGLDLSGGSHLIYKADVSGVPSGEVGSSMDALRDVIERRVNLFGVSEPVVQIQHGGFVSGGQEQLIVDLPGITDVKRAVEMIGKIRSAMFAAKFAVACPWVVFVRSARERKLNLDISAMATSSQLIHRHCLPRRHLRNLKKSSVTSVGQKK